MLETALVPVKVSELSCKEIVTTHTRPSRLATPYKVLPEPLSLVSLYFVIYIINTSNVFHLQSRYAVGGIRGDISSVAGTSRTSGNVYIAIPVYVTKGKNTLELLTSLPFFI